MNKRQFNIWVGAALLLAMLATCYAAADAVYGEGESPRMPEGYVQAVLSPAD